LTVDVGGTKQVYSDMMWVCHGLSPNGAWPPISDHFHAEHDEILLFLVSVFWVPNS